MWQCVAVCVAVFCSVMCAYSLMITFHFGLKFLGLKFFPFHFDVTGLGILSSGLQWVAVCCSGLQYVASVLQFVTVRCSELCCNLMRV